jgi:hypothetical protein
VPDHLQGVLLGDAGVDVAARLPGHGQVEALEVDQLRRVGHGLGGEGVRQVERVGVQVVGGRVAVERPADPDADPGVVQQRPDRGNRRSATPRSWPKLAIMCCSSLTPRCSVGQVVHGDRWPRSAVIDV